MGNNLIRNICICLIVISLFLLGLKNFDSAVILNNNSDKESSKNSTSSRMSYGKFLDYLEMGWVKQVDLYDSGRNAIIQASSPELGNRPQLIRVEIPVGASQLILKLKEYNIDFDAHPMETKNFLISIASNLLIPINISTNSEPATLKNGT